MNMVVCIKQILDPEIPARDFRVDSAKREAERGGANLVTNIFCENALETALQSRDAARRQDHGPERRPRRRRRRAAQGAGAEGRRRRAGRTTTRPIPIRCSSPARWPPPLRKLGQYDVVVRGPRGGRLGRRPDRRTAGRRAGRALHLVRRIDRAGLARRHRQGQAADRHRLGSARSRHAAGGDDHEPRQERAAHSQDARRDAVVSQAAGQVDAGRAGRRPRARPTLTTKWPSCPFRARKRSASSSKATRWKTRSTRSPSASATCCSSM